MRRLPAVILIFLVVACTLQENNAVEPTTTTVDDTTIKTDIETPMRQITLNTNDGLKIAASYYQGGERGIILLHQFMKDKSSYSAFAQQLQKEGYTVIAIDLRGHGESDGELASFTDKDFIAMLNDAIAAGDHLESEGKTVHAIIGASIGANTALRYAADHDVERAVLLSPGLSYKGIDIATVKTDVSTLVVASKGDAYSASSAQQLYSKNLYGRKQLSLLEGSSHGTNMLAEHRGLADEIIKFLK